MLDQAGDLPIRLISTDFDGTLFAELDDPPVPVVLQQLIADLQSQGARWVINTGRDLPGLLSTLAGPLLTITPDYLVVMEREIYVRAGAHFIGLEDWNGECREAHTALYRRVGREMPRLLNILGPRRAAFLRDDPMALFSILTGSEESARRLQEELQDFTCDLPGLEIVPSVGCLRVVHARYNKGTALAEIGRRLDISRDFILAAGDHFNDLPMMSGDVARWLVAPANAIDSIKESVRSQDGYVSHQPCGYGVASGLEFFIGVTAANLVAS